MTPANLQSCVPSFFTKRIPDTLPLPHHLMIHTWSFLEVKLGNCFFYCGYISIQQNAYGRKYMYLIKRDLRRLQPSKERTNKLRKNANQITNELLKSTVDPISRGEQEKNRKNVKFCT